MVRNGNHDIIFSPNVIPLAPMGEKLFHQTVNFHNNGPIWVKICFIWKEMVRNGNHDIIFPPSSTALPPWGKSFSPEQWNSNSKIIIRFEWNLFYYWRYLFTFFAHLFTFFADSTTFSSPIYSLPLPICNKNCQPNQKSLGLGGQMPPLGLFSIN